MVNSTEESGKRTQSNNDDKATSVSSNNSNSGCQQNSDKSDKSSTREAYFSALNIWLTQHTAMMQAQALFPFYFYASINSQAQAPPSQQTATQQSSQANGPVPDGDNNNIGVFQILDELTQADIINRSGGYEYTIASFWKRGIAETIDVILLFLLKILIIFTLVNLFNLNLGLDLDKDTLRKAIDDEDITSFLAISMDFLALSSDLLLLEMVTKIVVCVNEAIWTTLYGATPGKSLMNLKILHVDAILPLQPQAPPQMQIQFNREPIRALMYPAKTPGIGRAFMRAVAKNFIITLLFPMCFIMIFFKNNRTAYDVLTKTIVVENNPNPILRRQPQQPQQQR